MTRRLFAMLIFAALCWPVGARAKGRRITEAAAKADCEKVLSRLLQLAEKMLREEGAFVPFAGGLTKKGKVSLIAATEGAAAQSQDVGELVKMLTLGLQRAAQKGQYIATGMLVDGRVIPPGEAEKRSAIIAQLDHVSGYSLQLFVPYRFDDKRQPVFGQMFGTKGTNAIFAPGGTAQ